MRATSTSFSGAAWAWATPRSRCIRFNASLTVWASHGLATPTARWKAATLGTYRRTVAGALLAAIESMNAATVSGDAGRAWRSSPAHQPVKMGSPADLFETARKPKAQWNQGYPQAFSHRGSSQKSPNWSGRSLRSARKSHGWGSAPITAFIRAQHHAAANYRRLFPAKPSSRTGLKGNRGLEKTAYPRRSSCRAVLNKSAGDPIITGR